MAPVLSGISPATVPVRTATTITVTGSNFSNGAQINVGQQVITPTSISATALTATVTIPAAGNVSVTVTNPGGLRSNAVAFASLGAPPQIINFAPRSGSTGSSVAIGLIGQNFISGAKLYFGGQLLTPTDVNATMMLVKVVLPAAGNVLVRVVNPGNQPSNDVFFQITP
jgi:hypothetical protein